MFAMDEAAGIFKDHPEQYSFQMKFLAECATINGHEEQELLFRLIADILDQGKGREFLESSFVTGYLEGMKCRS